jgi:hypothetical protein
MIGKATRDSIINKIFKGEEPLPCAGNCKACLHEGLCDYFTPSRYYYYD